MSPPAEPRFRVRSTPEGAETPIASVEELQEMVELGEIPPDVELFDASIGQWAIAREVAVYRFLVEEIAAAGPLPDILGGVLDPEEDREFEGTAGVEGGREDDDSDRADTVDVPPDRSDSSGDAFDLKLDLVDADALPRAPDPGIVEEPQGFEGADHLEFTRDPAFGPEDTPPPVGFRPDRKGRAPDPVDPPPPVEKSPKAAEEDERWFTPAAEGGMVLPERTPEGRVEPEDTPAIWQPEAGDEGRPHPRRRLDRGIRVRPGLVAALVLVIGAGVAFSYFLGDSPIEGSEGGDQVGAVLERPLVRPIPPSLEEVGLAALVNLRTAFLFAGDSIRESLDLAPVPPSSWLSGGYLASAGDYPEVPEFWGGYLAFLTEMGGRDREIYFAAVEASLDSSAASGEERDELLEYFDERYERRESYRQARYAHLADAAEAALHLHEVLVRHQDEIVHSPALGGGVSADPILEAVIPAGPIRTEVDEALDRVFQALDRSRGGGAPAVEGMRAELFGGFGDPD
ncbi:MAG: hypothetical protein WD960_06540 [Gemmatimonadota bacterium]